MFLNIKHQMSVTVISVSQCWVAWSVIILSLIAYRHLCASWLLYILKHIPLSLNNNNKTYIFAKAKELIQIYERLKKKKKKVMLSLSNKSPCQSSLLKHPYVTPPKTENKPIVEGKIQHKGRGINTSVLHRTEFKGCTTWRQEPKHFNKLFKKTLQFPKTAELRDASPSTKPSPTQSSPQTSPHPRSSPWQLEELSTGSPAAGWPSRPLSTTPPRCTAACPGISEGSSARRPAERQTYSCSCS